MNKFNILVISLIIMITGNIPIADTCSWLRMQEKHPCATNSNNLNEILISFNQGMKILQLQETNKRVREAEELEREATRKVRAEKLEYESRCFKGSIVANTYDRAKYQKCLEEAERNQTKNKYFALSN